MPREARPKSKSGIYHIVIRGNDRKNIFDDIEDCERFIGIVRASKMELKFILLAYCLLDNHIHLLVREGSTAVSDIVKNISTSYVRWYNKKNNKKGKLFHDRYLSDAVDDEVSLMENIRYIHNNPKVHEYEKHMVSIENYEWCSYKDYLNDQLVITDTDLILGLLSDNQQQARRYFEKFMKIEKEDLCIDIGRERVSMPDGELEELILETYQVSKEGFAKLAKEEQLKILKELKQVQGVSIRQIARVLEIGKFIVEKA